MSEAAPFPRQPTAPVLLSRICDLLSLPRAAGSVTGVTLASNTVQPGDLYAALPGAKTHGARFATQAIAAGAAALTAAPAPVAANGYAQAPVRNFPPIDKRHLAFFILPVGLNGCWRRAVDQLRARWSLFTGRKIFAVATGDTVREQVDAQEGDGPPKRDLPIEPVSAVRAYLPSDAEVFEVPNDGARWESAS